MKETLISGVSAAINSRTGRTQQKWKQNVLTGPFWFIHEAGPLACSVCKQRTGKAKIPQFTSLGVLKMSGSVLAANQ